MPAFVHDLLDETASRSPAKVAIRTEEGTVTFAELATASRRLAGWFHAQGVQRGDRILILLPNGIPAVIAIFAASRLGAIFSIVSPGTKWFHLNHILEDSQPRVILTTSGLSQQYELSRWAITLTSDEGWDAALNCPPLPSPVCAISMDPASLIYTSGSTGKPKAVVSTHRNVLFATEAIQGRLNMQESDVVGCFLPISFDYGLYQIYLCCRVGATLALGTEAYAGAALLGQLNAWQVTGLPLVPALAANLIRLTKRRGRGALSPSLRYITNTGAHLPQTYVEELNALFPDCRIFLMYGLTECKRVSILLPEERLLKPNSVGRPLPDTECLIVNPDGRVLPPGERGELVVRGPHVMAGYWRAPELTEQRFRSWGPSPERVLFTGDSCWLDADGYLYFSGRLDDIYKQNGYRVSALEIEEAACAIASVNQAALLTPDADSPAVLCFTGETSVGAVLAGLRERLEDYKIPPRIVQMATFPLTTNRKVDKQQLRLVATNLVAGEG